MVGRLIENQKVRFRKHKLGEGNTSSFSTTQITDLFKYVIAREKKSGESISDLCIGERRVVIRNLFKKSLFWMKYMVFLIIISDMYIGPQGDNATVSFQNAIDNL